jgi:hypothetical protein
MSIVFRTSHSWVKNILLALLCAIVSFAHGAEAQVSVRTEISPTSGSVDDLFLFTVIVEGSQAAPPPLLSGGDDFNLRLLGPRSTISIVNGTMRSRVSYVYHLTPKHEGKLGTPQAEVTIDGKVFSAPSVEVPVAHGMGNGHKDAAAPTGDAILLKQTAAPSHVYQGQQIRHAITVYTRVDLSELNMEDLTNDGFWQETIASNDRSLRQIDNQQYTAVEMINALFPLRSGTLTLPARKLQAKAPFAQNKPDSFSFDPFSDDFFNQFFNHVDLRPVTVSSNAITIEVKPLPPAPADIQPRLGAVPIVGATSVRVFYPPEAINTGETKTITVEVTSEGNLNPLKTVPLTAVNSFKIYEERPETHFERIHGKLITKKSFKFSVVPLSPGLARIPGVKVAYFDPTTGKYATAISADLAFPVQGRELSSTLNQENGQIGVPPSADTIHAAGIPTLPPIPVAPPLAYQETSLVAQIPSYVSVQLALLILAGVVGAGIIALSARQRSAISGAITSSLSSLNDIHDLKELENFLRELISTRVSRVSETSSMDELRARVATAVPDQAIALALSSVLDDIELINYGDHSTPRAQDISSLKERLGMILMQWRR